MASSFPYLAAFVTLPIIYWVTHSIYRLYFDPLSAYPGPKAWAASSIPAAVVQLKGLTPYKLAKLHKKYGPVVRVGPRVLSYNTAEAWGDITGKTRPQLVKDPQAGPPPPNGVRGLAFTEHDDAHARMRRNLAHGFSEKALREQEPLLRKYVDLMIQKLQEHSITSPVDLSSWFNFITTDIIGDLTFGESFRCLEESTLHSWMDNIFFFLKAFVITGVITRIIPFMDAIFWLAKHIPSFAEKEARHRGFINEKLAHRLQIDDPKPDFMTYVQRHQGTPTGMSIEELQETCNALMLGGSETTASLLSATIYYLLKNPEIYARLNNEIRSAFKNTDEITIVGTNRLTYQAAVIEEGLRISPPLPQQIQRVTGPDGNVIMGKYVPGGTKVGVTHWAAYHSPSNFKDPDDFVPERWLGDEKYRNDRKDVMKPFSTGPRNCIGINLAYAEIKLILSRLLWEFDMELCQESSDWAHEIKVYAVYQRQPLMVRLRPVTR